jgi:hypothetical protein
VYFNEISSNFCGDLLQKFFSEAFLLTSFFEYCNLMKLSPRASSAFTSFCSESASKLKPKGLLKYLYPLL